MVDNVTPIDSATKTTANKQTPLAIAADYLSHRGISTATADACGIEIHGKAECLDRLKMPTRSTPFEAGVLFPMGTRGAVQVAFVSPVSTFDVKPAKKLSTAASVGALGLFAPPIDWLAIDTLYLCESPTKAAVLFEHGLPAVAGFGVNSIYTRTGFISEWPADHIAQLKRVVILFDADWAINPKIVAAVRKLATAIRREWPAVGADWLKLPPLPHETSGLYDEKAGIDDWCAAITAAEGSEAAREWLHEFIKTSEKAPESDPLMVHLDQLNDKYVVCLSPGVVIDRQTSGMSKSADVAFFEATRTFMDTDHERPRKVVPFKEWTEWDGRNSVPRVKYLPGGEAFVPGEYFNLWQDDAPPAVPGDISPFMAVYDNAIPEAAERAALWQCMAHMVQRPQVKLPKALYFVGREMGTGKSLLADTIATMVGPSNSARIETDDLTESFNDDWITKQVVIMDDLTKVYRKQFGRMKELVTATTVKMKVKQLSPVTLDNYLVFIMTANERDAVPILAGDRRVLTVSFQPACHHESGTDYWDTYVKWLHEGGYGHLKHWLQTYDLTDFNPAFMPPQTAMREELTEITINEDERFAMAVQADPVGTLDTERSVFTTEELWAFMREDIPRDMLNFGMLLKTLGFRKWKLGKQIKLQGRPTRLWAVRERSLQWTNEQVRADLAKYPLGEERKF